MIRSHRISTLILLALAFTVLTGFGHDQAFWSQWGRTAQHQGMVNVAAQPLNRKLADIVYDPFAMQEEAEIKAIGGEYALTAHYQATLIDGNSFYMVLKSGTYDLCQPLAEWYKGGNCGPNAWGQLIWNVVRYDWQQENVAPAWTFTTDWKPEPSGTNVLQSSNGLFASEPVFHPALANGYLYVPGAGGTVWKVDVNTGQSQAPINPFAGTGINPAATFVAGPLTADASGNIFYNVIELDLSNPWSNDVLGAWLAKISPDDSSATVTFANLVPNAPPGNSTNCPGTFLDLANSQSYLPWPPGPNAVPPTVLCGSQRPALNVAPAVGPDGTVYTVSRAHLDAMVASLVAVNPDLSLKWAASLQNVLSDGCGVLLKIAPPHVDDLANSCRYGTTVGVDPTTNAKGSAVLNDAASSSPTVLPDGSILYGTLDNYNYDRGHLMHFDAKGNFVNAYTFGWDTTPGVYQHDNTYSIVLKDNYYGVPAYCFFASPVCAFPPPGPYYMTQLDANLNVEWSLQNITIDSEHPNGYEWCVNAPVIDKNGIVYAGSEDGHLYSIPQGNKGVFKKPKQRIFLQEILAAAYTPLSVGEDGKIYTQNDGHLFVVGK